MQIWDGDSNSNSYNLQALTGLQEIIPGKIEEASAIVGCTEEAFEILSKMKQKTEMKTG